MGIRRVGEVETCWDQSRARYLPGVLAGSGHQPGLQHYWLRANGVMTEDTFGSVGQDKSPVGS